MPPDNDFQQSTGSKPCPACNGRGEQCGPGGEMECRECDGLGTLPIIAPRPLVPGKSVRMATPPASTCIEHAYGTTTRLSFQIKVF